MKTTIKTRPMKKLIYLMILISGICNAQIVNIPDANFKAQLIALGVDTNSDGEIQESEALVTTSINVTGANIFDLTGVEAFVNLTYLNCDSNHISTLNVNNLINLTSLYCSLNQLTTMDVSNLVNLKSFYCFSNQISSININGLTNLWILHFENNQLTTLDLSGITDYPVFVDCSNNNLSTLFIKNNRNVVLDNIGFYCQCSGNMYFYNNPNLTYVCCDEGEIASIQALSGVTTQVNGIGTYSNFMANSYCSFTPGGNYNTIVGNIKYDTNNNGCDVNDGGFPNIRVNINDGTSQGATFSNVNGGYNFYTQAGTFAITPAIENPSWFNFSPTTAEVVFADNNNNITTQDFCIAANGFHPDIEVLISPITTARPGFDATYQLTCRNKGNYTYSQVELALNFDQFVLDYVSSTENVSFQFEGSISWTFDNLSPFENKSVDVTFNVNSPTETPAVNIGDILSFQLACTPLEVDETSQDNFFTYNQTVVGSFDPNQIICLEGDSVPPSEIGNYLHYAINFENTGNFPAENVVVKTEVDATKFDINSLQLLNTSTPVDARITGNKVEFIFKNIQLPIGGHGHILLKIKSKTTLVTSDSVSKRADIFFDYNAPVDTGFANTTFETLSNTVFEPDNSINIFPNPTTSKININSDYDLKSVQVYDVQGRILETILGTTKILDISNKENGIYFLKITTQKGSKIVKVVKK